MEKPSAARLENPIAMTDFFATFEAIPPARTTNVVMIPSTDPRITGRNTVLTRETGFSVEACCNTGGTVLVVVEKVVEKVAPMRPNELDPIFLVQT